MRFAGGILRPTNWRRFGEAEEQIALICEFLSETAPAAWTVWPLSRSRGWLHMIGGRFQDSDFAILEEDAEM